MFTPHNMSHVTCHMSYSCVAYHVSHVIFLFFQTNWWTLLVEGLLSTGLPRLVYNWKRYLKLFKYKYYWVENTGQIQIRIYFGWTKDIYKYTYEYSKWYCRIKIWLFFHTWHPHHHHNHHHYHLHHHHHIFLGKKAGECTWWPLGISSP